MANDCDKLIVVSGSTGFIGRRVVERLVDTGLVPICLCRSIPKWLKDLCDQGNAQPLIVDVADQDALLHELQLRLTHADVVFIAVAGVGLKKMTDVNDNFNQRAADALVHVIRYIRCRSFHLRYVSTIKVNARTRHGSRLTGTCAYASSKMQAETQLLLAVSASREMSSTPLSLCLVRAPAVYGVGDVNFNFIFKLADRGILFRLPDSYNRPGPLIHVDRLASVLTEFSGELGKIEVCTVGYMLDINTIVSAIAGEYKISRILVIPSVILFLIRLYARVFNKIIVEQRFSDLLDSNWKLENHPEWIADDIRLFRNAVHFRAASALK